jgi:hypothetical protein
VSWGANYNGVADKKVVGLFCWYVQLGLASERALKR